MEEELKIIADEFQKYKFRNSERVLVPILVIVKALEEAFKKGDRTKEIIVLIKKEKVISENSYGEVDSDEIKLVKYLIDREALIKKIKRG